MFVERYENCEVSVNFVHVGIQYESGQHILSAEAKYLKIT